LAGAGWYVLFLSLSCSCGSRCGLALRYASQLCPSTPAPPLLRTTRCSALCRFSIFHTLSIRLNHLPPLTPLVRAANMRSVHTLAWVHCQCGGTSLPCL